MTIDMSNLRNVYKFIQEDEPTTDMVLYDL